MKRRLLLLLVLSLTSNLVTFTQPTTLPDLIENITTKQIHRMYAEWGGVTSMPYPSFEKLKKIASIKELVRLTRHKNGLVRCYAAWALFDLKYPNFDQIFKEIIENDKEIKVRSGCFGMLVPLSSEVYSRVQGIKYDSLNWVTDSLYFINLETKLDQLILYHKKANNYLIHQALQNKTPQEKDYLQIRKLALKKKNESALDALAKFQKQENILPIIKFGAGNFRAISLFPDTKFWVYLMQSYPRLEKDRSTTQAFLNAVAAFKNTDALKVLNDIVQYGVIKEIDWLIQYVNVAILNNQAVIYENLIIELWEEYGVIDKVTISYLKEKNDITIFENGLLNKHKKRYSDYLSHSYHADYFLEEMLDLLTQQKSEQLIPIINSLLVTANFMQLPVVTNKVIELKPASSVSILVLQLKAREDTYLKFHILEALLSYQDKNHNSQIVEILKNNRDWDWGNWSDSFRALLAENDIKL